jgi:predicted metal-binding membrane protein
VTTLASTPERVGFRLGMPAAVAVAIAAGWVLAMGAELAGYGGTIHGHGGGTAAAGTWAALALFLLAWQAMIAAMMLPSSLPLIRLYAVASRRQERPGVVLAAFLGSYALVWTVFGAVAFLADLAFHRGVEGVAWVHERPLLVAGVVLGLAGAFQYSGLKDRCLSKCRHPGPYLLSRYRRGVGGAVRLGTSHGLFCLGCCWALMLVMFAVGTAVLWWMAALTAVMVYEKTGRHGALLSRWVGVALITLAGLFVLGSVLVGPGGGHQHGL